MNRTFATITTVAALALVGAGYGLYRFGVQQGAERAAPPASSTAATSAAASPGTSAAAPGTSAAAPATSASGENAATAALSAGSIDPANGKRVLYWHDPMVPGRRFDKPGKSPFMDMQLVPMYADDAAGTGPVSSVAIDSRLQQNLGIRTTEVTRGSLAQPIDAVGTIAYNERDVAVVQARANGFVERLFVRAPLDPVKKGQPLAELYVPDWVAAQEEFLTVRRMQLDTRLLEGAKQRMRLAGMSDDQIAAVEAGGRVQARQTLHAPIGGIVAELGAREGMTVMAGAPLFRLNGLGTVWVNAEVPESAAALVRPGASVEATTPALGERVFRGKVSALLPEVNPATRTIKARVELANPGGQLVPGMFARVSFAPSAGRDVLLVPSDAVIRTGRRNIVMEALADGRFAPREVELGAENGGQSEIRKGLAAGQKVVVSGQFLIDSEASLKGLDLRLKDAPAGSAGASLSGATSAAAGPPGATAASRMASAGSAKSATAPGEVHRGTGRVESIDEREVMLSHGPIASLKWPAMTMGFKLPVGRPKNVAPGSTVQFEFRATKGGEYEIVTLQPATEPPPAAEGARK